LSGQPEKRNHEGDHNWPLSKAGEPQQREGKERNRKKKVDPSVIATYLLKERPIRKRAEKGSWLRTESPVSVETHRRQRKAWTGGEGGFDEQNQNDDPPKSTGRGGVEALLQIDLWPGRIGIGNRMEWTKPLSIASIVFGGGTSPIVI